MEISIDKAPPTHAEIKSEMIRIKTELNFLKRHRNKVFNSDHFRFCIMSHLLIVVYLWNPLGFNNPITSYYKTELIALTIILCVIPIILMEMLNFKLLGFVCLMSIDKKIKATKYSFLALNIINESDAAEIVLLCQSYPEIDKYRSTVANLDRVLIIAELIAMKCWIANTLAIKGQGPGETAFERLHRPDSMQTSE
jgi:hypothetical protein